MSSTNTSVAALPSEYSGQSVNQTAVSNTNPPLAPLRQSRSSLHGPVAILWDIENCPVPSDVGPEDVAGNIRMALQVHPIIDGAVTLFSAYGDFNAFPRRLREGCQRTGVKLVDVPNGRKDAADKAILVDMFLFALDNRPPSSIMLISGDVDFAPALHILGQRGYTVVLVIPSGVGVSSALSSAGRFVWDWPIIARGEGFVTPAKSLTPSYAGPTEIARYLTGCHISDNVEGQNEEESVVYRGISKVCKNAREYSMVSPSPSECSTSSILMLQNATGSRSRSLPSGGLNEVSTGTEQDLTWVQPGDINGLKGQLVKLLKSSGGSLPLTRLPSEYQKKYGRPLYVSEYRAFKFVDLLKKMSDAIAIEGNGQRKTVCIRNNSKSGSVIHQKKKKSGSVIHQKRKKSGSVGPSVILSRKEKMGKRAQEDNIDTISGGPGSSDELSDDEGVDTRENDSTDHNLKNFKYELQEILVSYSCRIFLGCFEAIYCQRHKRQLDYPSFGVNHLEELLEKVRDVVILQEEPVSKKRFLVAVGR